MNIHVGYHMPTACVFRVTLSQVCFLAVMWQSDDISVDLYITWVIYHISSPLSHDALISLCVILQYTHMKNTLKIGPSGIINIHIHTHRLLKSDYHVYMYASTTHVLYVCMTITKQSIYYLLPHKPASQSLSIQLVICTCCISAKPTSQFAVHVLSFTYMCKHTIQSPCNHMLFTNTVTVARIKKEYIHKKLAPCDPLRFPSGPPEWRHNYTPTSL